MKPQVQEPPHNLSAEQATLADVLLDKQAAIRACSFLTAEDFYRESHKLIFAAAQELVEKDIAIDYISMMDILKTKDQLEAVGGLVYLMSLFKASPTAANLEQHMKIIKKEAIKRQLLRFGREVMASTASGEDVAAQLDQALQSLNAIMSDSRSSDFSDMEAMLEEYIATIASKNPEAGGLSGVSTSFSGLCADKLPGICGWH